MTVTNPIASNFQHESFKRVCDGNFGRLIFPYGEIAFIKEGERCEAYSTHITAQVLHGHDLINLECSPIQYRENRLYVDVTIYPHADFLSGIVNIEDDPDADDVERFIRRMRDRFSLTLRLGVDCKVSRLRKVSKIVAVKDSANEALIEKVSEFRADFENDPEKLDGYWGTYRDFFTKQFRFQTERYVELLKQYAASAETYQQDFDEDEALQHFQLELENLEKAKQIRIKQIINRRRELALRALENEEENENSGLPDWAIAQMKTTVATNSIFPTKSIASAFRTIK